MGPSSKFTARTDNSTATQLIEVKSVIVRPTKIPIRITSRKSNPHYDDLAIEQAPKLVISKVKDRESLTTKNRGTQEPH